MPKICVVADRCSPRDAALRTKVVGNVVLSNKRANIDPDQFRSALTVAGETVSRDLFTLQFAG